MRLRFVLPAIAIASLGVVACDGRPISGPDAQAAFSQAVARYKVVPDGRLVFVDDQQLGVGQSLDHLDPRAIARIEVLKGDAAARLYGDNARAGVIRVYTFAGAQTTAPNGR